MITQDFKSNSSVVFADNGAVQFNDGHGAIVALSAAEFMEFMLLAMHVHHQRSPQFGPSFGYGDVPAQPAKKKRGRPATKSVTAAKRGRPRKA